MLLILKWSVHRCNGKSISFWVVLNAVIRLLWNKVNTETGVVNEELSVNILYIRPIVVVNQMSFDVNITVWAHVQVSQDWHTVSRHCWHSYITTWCSWPISRIKYHTRIKYKTKNSFTIRHSIHSMSTFFKIIQCLHFLKSTLRNISDINFICPPNVNYRFIGLFINRRVGIVFPSVFFNVNIYIYIY